MSAFNTTCAVCASEIQAQRNTRKTCGPACRQRLRLVVQAQFRADAAELLRDQSAALQAGGDPVVLAALERRAARLFATV